MGNFRSPLYLIIFIFSFAAFESLSSANRIINPLNSNRRPNAFEPTLSSTEYSDLEGFEFAGSSVASLDITFPTQGVFLCPGNTVAIQWLQSQLVLVDIEFSSDGGTTWSSVQTSFSATLQQFQWTVPSVQSSQCLIRLSDAQAVGTDATSGLFSIGSPSFINPNGGEILSANNPYQISWDGFLNSPASLELSIDNGSTWSQIATGLTGNTYFWNPVSSFPSSQCLLRISDASSGVVLDITDSIFSIDNLILGTNTILTDSVVGALCRQDTVQVYYSTSGSYGFGNQFIAQISNASGLFNNPLNIGAISSQTGGVINAIIPDSLPSGTAYYIRVLATNQPVMGSPYLIPLQLGGSSVDFSAVQTFRVLPNDANVLLNFIGQSSAIQSFSWDFGNGGTSNTMNTSHNYSAPGFYDIGLTTTDGSGCLQQRIKQDYIQVEVQFPSVPLALGSPVNAMAVDFIDTLRGCFAMSDGTCRITLDGGQTFTGSPTGAIGALKAASLMPGKWMVAGEQGFVASSADVGITWNPFNISFLGTIHALSMSSPYRGLLVGSSGQAFFFDSLAWLPISTGITETLYSVLSDGTTGFACGENGTILKFTVSAPSSLNSGTNETLKGIYFSGSSVYAVGPAGLVVKSQDGGNTFNTILSGLDTDLNAITGSGTDTVWAFGTKGIILQSFDGGATWDRFTNGTLNDNNGGNYKAERKKGWTAGSGGNALVFGGGGAGSSLKEQALRTLSLFPNPASDELFIELSDAQSLVSLRIFDAIGRTFTIPQTKNANGFIRLDLSALPNGTYFIEASSGIQRKIGRFVICK